jgi:hypothetical protein
VSLTPSLITLEDRWKHARRSESLSEVNSLYILGVLGLLLAFTGVHTETENFGH